MHLPAEITLNAKRKLPELCSVCLGLTAYIEKLAGTPEANKVFVTFWGSMLLIYAYDCCS